MLGGEGKVHLGMGGTLCQRDMEAAIDPSAHMFAPPPSLMLAGECGRAHLLCAPLTQYAPLNTPLRFPSLPPLSQPRRVPCSLCWVQACQETMSPAPRCERVCRGQCDPDMSGGEVAGMNGGGSDEDPVRAK